MSDSEATVEALAELKQVMEKYGLTIDCGSHGFPRVLQHDEVVLVSRFSWLGPSWIGVPG